ncbi:MAG: RHS repeat-associated core domain-containing protein, partial [Flavobacteriales bacterium]|nr:RHS repeat-associated core domain-containing protein [Flavobacteriales bacterium]
RQLNIYGETRRESGEKNFIPFLYQGQYFDEETELAYNRFRYYDCSAGVYISQDPIRLEGGYSFYSYVHDTNVFIDPLGWIEIIRTMSETEANLTADNKGLVRGKNNSRGAKWVSVGQDYDTAKASTYKVVFDMDDSADEFLKSDNLDYEDLVGGEKSNTNKILTKSNEKGAYGIGVDKLDDFNSKVKKITVYKKDKGRWKKVKTIGCG